MELDKRELDCWITRDDDSFNVADEWDDFEPPEPITDDPQFPTGTTVSVSGRGGVAWRVREIDPSDDRVICRMVGDDRDFRFDRDELTPLAREKFCGECGQIGCTHDGLDRDDPA